MIPHPPAKSASLIRGTGSDPDREVRPLRVDCMDFGRPDHVTSSSNFNTSPPWILPCPLLPVQGRGCFVSGLSFQSTDHELFTRYAVVRFCTDGTPTVALYLYGALKLPSHGHGVVSA